MHTLSSARRTCMASASAVECTATVAMPSSLHARWMRSAISPRLAMRTLSNILCLFDDNERLAELDRLTVLDKDRRDLAGVRGGDLVHRFHGFDDEQRVALCNLRADLDECRRAGLGRAIGGADHRRFDDAWMLGGILHCRGCGGGRSGGMSRRGRERRLDVDGSRNAHLEAALLDLDLAQAGLVEELGKLTDQL